MSKNLIVFLCIGAFVRLAISQPASDWQEVSISEMAVPDEAPKPVSITEFGDAQARRPFRSFEGNSRNRIVDQTLGNPNRNRITPPTRQALMALDRETRLGFFGTPVPFRFDSPMVFRIGRNLETRDISAAWAKLQRSKYAVMIQQLKSKSQDLGLNDWGYYQLLASAARRMYPRDPGAQVLFTAFCMDKSGFAVRICGDGSRLHLAMPMKQMVYQNTYFHEGNTRFFLVDPKNGTVKVRRLRVLSLPYSNARKKVDLSLREAPKMNAVAPVRNLSFEYRGKRHKIAVPVNKSLVAFYKTFPFTDLNVQGSAPLSAGARNALTRGLKPLIEGKSQLEATAILLKFVQTAFPYQTDQKQFGKENYLFAEEMLYYPYSDCEDRSVLFGWLVEELIGLETIGLIFPGHAATAVRFTERMVGDAITYRGQRYVICDPTYINAPPGRCMPAVLNKRVEVVDI